MSHILRLLILSLFLSVVTVSCSQGCSGADSDTHRYSKEELALRKDIGEMLLVGFRGTSIASDSHIVRDIKDYHIGGVILFEYDAPSGRRPRNVTSPHQLKRLCHHLQRLGDEPLLVSIDQEGGRVNRLKEKYGFPIFSSARATAAMGPDSVRSNAARTARTLDNMGINLNFAPCVDVDVNPDCPVIGKLERSFSSDPADVARCAEIWIEEQNKHHVVSCLKHFPGHGSSYKDSHAGLVDVSQSWQRKELEPYKTLIAKGEVEMIMTTHVFNSQLDSVWPATLSFRTLTGLLRDSLGYQGVIITDDLAMGAMTKQYEYTDILMNTINAGADMLCLSNNGQEYNPDVVPQTVDIIFQLVKEGKVKPSRIRQAAHRIRVLKKKL